MPHFFISRAGEDIEWRAWIADIPREGGDTFFLQEDDVHSGHNFVGKMVEGMEESDHMIAVISPDHLVKPHCKGELQSAYARDPTGENRTLVEQTGYHRRDAEVAQLRETLK